MFLTWLNRWNFTDFYIFKSFSRQWSRATLIYGKPSRSYSKRLPFSLTQKKVKIFWKLLLNFCYSVRNKQERWHIHQPEVFSHSQLADVWFVNASDCEEWQTMNVPGENNIWKIKSWARTNLVMFPNTGWREQIPSVDSTSSHWQWLRKLWLLSS